MLMSHDMGGAWSQLDCLPWLVQGTHVDIDKQTAMSTENTQSAESSDYVMSFSSPIQHMCGLLMCPSFKEFQCKTYSV